MNKQALATLRADSLEQLEVKLVELERELARLRLEVKAGKNPKARPARLADEIAIVKTLLNEKKALL